MANRFWILGTGTWNTSTTTNWSATSGGTGGASAPTSSDSVFIDGNSGTGVITVASGASCLDFTSTSYTGTITTGVSASILISGNVIMGINQGCGLSFNKSGTASLTTNGFSATAFIVATSSTTVSLQDNLNWTASQIANNAGGILTTNNFNVAIKNYVQQIGASTINMGSSIFTLFGTGNVWVSSAGTVNSGTSSILINDSTNTAISFLGGSFTYNNLSFTRGASTASNTITGSNTFNTLQDTGTAAHSILFTAGTNQTVSTWSVSGTPGNLITISSTTTGTHILSSPSGIINADYLNIQHSIATGGAIWYAGIHSVNNQTVPTAGNGWIFTLPAKPDLTFRSNIAPFSTMSQIMYAQSKDGGKNLSVLHGEVSNPLYFRIYNNFAMNNGIPSAVNVQITTFDNANPISHTAFNAPVSQLWLHVMEIAYGENSTPITDLITKYYGTDTPVGSNTNVYTIEEGSDGVSDPVIRAGTNSNGVGYVELKTYVSVPTTIVGGNYPFVISVIYEYVL